MAKVAPRRPRAGAAVRAERRWYPDVGLFAAAFLLRLLYLLSIRNAYFFHHLQTEALRYHQWAMLILDAATPPHPPFEQSPGYAYFVAAIYTVLGRRVFAVAAVQALLDATSGVMIAAAARHWFGPRAGIIAGLLAATYGPLIYFTGEEVPATLFVFVTMLAMNVALRRRWTLAGALWGLALVVRSETLLAFPWVLLDAWRRGRQSGTARVLVPLLGVWAIVVGVNAAYSPKLVLLTTSGGLNLWVGNNPYADGVNPFPSGPLVQIEESVRARAADAADWDATLRGYALAFWKDQPFAAAQLVWKKFLWTWTNRELPNTIDIDWQIGQSWLFWPPLFPLSFGVILPLAAAGAMLVGREWRELSLLGALISIGVGSATIFFTNARFRLVMIPSLLILAAVLLDRLPRMFRQRRQARRAIVLVAIAMGVGLLAAWSNVYGVRTYQVPQIEVNIGVQEREAGNFDSAVRFLRAGLAQTPDDALAWIHLALALDQQGNTSGSIQAYLDGLAQVPRDGELQTMAGRGFQLHGLDPALVQTYVAADSEAARHEVRQRILQALR